MVISFVVNTLSETRILDFYPRRRAFYQPLHKEFPPDFEHLPFKAVSRSVAPCQVSYSLNSDLGTHIGVRAGGGGEGGCSPPPVAEIFVIFSGKTLMIRAKVLGRKYSKRLSKPDLKATFSDVCLVKTELKSNDLRIQVFVLEKPYIVYTCLVEIHEMKQGQNQSKRRPTTSDKTC